MSSKWPGLPSGVESRTLKVNDLEMHILEALPTNSAGDSKLIILLHGFPELAYSWRKVIRPLADAGYHVVAPDQRGHGRTKSSAQEADSPIKYTDDTTPFRMTNLVKDVVALVYALGYKSAAVVGHDFGSPVAAYCALIRPDIFRCVVMMSGPFTGPPKLALANGAPSGPGLSRIAAALAALDPPRKHYMMYNSSPDANAHMTNPPQGLRAFLREYYHVKSADWAPNKPHPLAAPEAAVMAQLPRYYMMGLHETMPEAVHGFRPSPAEIAGNKWLTEEELGVYVAEYSRTGFQGGLNGSRIFTNPEWQSDCELFAGKWIEVPAMFLGGKQDWATYMNPGAVDAMRGLACSKMDDEDFVLIDGAGHWLQQEQSGDVVKELLRFFNKCAK